MHIHNQNYSYTVGYASCTMKIIAQILEKKYYRKELEVFNIIPTMHLD